MKITQTERYLQTFSPSGDQLEGKTDGGEAAVTRTARSQPAATAAAAAATTSATGGCATEEVQEQRRRAELPLATNRRNDDGGDDDEPEVAGAAVAAAASHDAIALSAGTYVNTKKGITSTGTMNHRVVINETSTSGCDVQFGHII